MMKGETHPDEEGGDLWVRDSKNHMALVSKEGAPCHCGRRKCAPCIIISDSDVFSTLIFFGHLSHLSNAAFSIAILWIEPSLMRLLRMCWMGCNEFSDPRIIWRRNGRQLHAKSMQQNHFSWGIFLVCFQCCSFHCSPAPQNLLIMLAFNCSSFIVFVSTRISETELSPSRGYQASWNNHATFLKRSKNESILTLKRLWKKSNPMQFIMSNWITCSEPLHLRGFLKTCLTVVVSILVLLKEFMTTCCQQQLVLLQSICLSGDSRVILLIGRKVFGDFVASTIFGLFASNGVIIENKKHKTHTKCAGAAKHFLLSFILIFGGMDSTSHSDNETANLRVRHVIPSLSIGSLSLVSL